MNITLIQFNIFGEKVAEFSSLPEAIKATGDSLSAIKDSLKKVIHYTDNDFIYALSNDSRIYKDEFNNTGLDCIECIEIPTASDDIDEFMSEFGYNSNYQPKIISDPKEIRDFLWYGGNLGLRKYKIKYKI